MLTAFFSGPGQTFLVSIFTPDLMAEYGLTASAFGAIYSGASLVGAVGLPFIGRLIDRTELLLFTFLMGSFMTAGCLILGLSQAVWMMALGFVMIRLFGMGAMSMTSSTITAKAFEHRRGKALSLASIGHPLSSALFPLLVSFWVAEYGWRSGWNFLALLIGAVFFPATFYLLRNQAPHTRYPMHEKNRRSGKDLTTKELFKNPLFLPAVLSGMVTPALLTALFLYQLTIGEWKGWSPQLLAAAFILFSVFRALMSFAVGPLIDRFSASYLLRFMLVPLLLGLLSLRLGYEPMWAFFYLALSGVTVGGGMNVKPAFWVEIFGAQSLGSVKGITGFFAIVATAATPPVLGWLIDRGVSFETILNGCVAIAGVGVLLSLGVSIAAAPTRSAR